MDERFFLSSLLYEQIISLFKINNMTVRSENSIKKHRLAFGDLWILNVKI